MKFTKFGKALLISALSAGVILGVSSCVRSYTVGFIYVTGTVTAQSTGNGMLSPQATFFTQGVNPFRLIADGSGNYLMVLDHDSPSNSTCKLALGASATTCGDITIFQINQTTGRLTLVVNAQVTAAGGTPLTYFPVPANPIDFVLSAGYVLTLSGTPATGDSVFPYVYSGATGQ